VEAMAKELEALKSQLHDDGNHRMTESPSRTEPSQHSPDRPTEPSGLVVLDESGLDYDQFQLDDFVIAKPTVIEIFKLYVIEVNLKLILTTLTMILQVLRLLLPSLPYSEPHDIHLRYPRVIASFILDHHCNNNMSAHAAIP
jgi:hypothetical protein